MWSLWYCPRSTHGPQGCPGPGLLQRVDEELLGCGEVTVHEHHQVPDHSEHQPREQEGEGEAKNCPRPGSTNHWGEEIFQVPANISVKILKLLLRGVSPLHKDWRYKDSPPNFLIYRGGRKNIIKGAINVKKSIFKDYGLLILPLTLNFHFGETTKNGHNSGQKLSNPVGKSY